MSVAFTHIGELVSEDINDRFGHRLNRSDITKVTLTLPDGTEIEVPVETQVQVEY